MVVDHVLHLLGGAVDPWAYPVVFVATALEASALVGLVVPGEAVLLVAGFLDESRHDPEYGQEGHQLHEERGIGDEQVVGNG